METLDRLLRDDQLARSAWTRAVDLRALPDLVGSPGVPAQSDRDVLDIHDRDGRCLDNRHLEAHGPDCHSLEGHGPDCHD